MVIVDTALERRRKEGNPVRVAMVGAGYMGSIIALELATAVEGMELVAISNRTLAKAAAAYAQAGIESIDVVTTLKQLEDSIAMGRHAITDDPMLLCQAGNVDAIVDATANIEVGAQVAMEAIANGKHLILMNAELDATLGPILKVYADRAGVVVTYTDGDEPGVAMNLYRFLKTVGYEPVLMGQIKGILDRYRDPETQREFAAKHHQRPEMVASFADGSKLSLESTIMANATGFGIVRRGMRGPNCAHVKDVLDHFTEAELRNSGGLVDFVLGAEPGTGAFVVGFNDHPVKQEYMQYFKMGKGPFHVFYTPFHLAHLQLPLSVARAVLFHDATITPKGGPVCDTVATAKTDLKSGTVLDGMGGFTCYGMIDSYEASRKQNLLPMTLSHGCRLRNNIRMDQSISYADVDLPIGRLCDKLRQEQTVRFAPLGLNVIK